MQKNGEGEELILLLILSRYCSSNVVRCCLCGGIVDESGKNGSSAHMAALAYLKVATSGDDTQTHE